MPNTHQNKQKRVHTKKKKTNKKENTANITT